MRRGRGEAHQNLAGKPFDAGVLLRIVDEWPVRPVELVELRRRRSARRPTVQHDPAGLVQLRGEAAHVAPQPEEQWADVDAGTSSVGLRSKKPTGLSVKPV